MQYDDLHAFIDEQEFLYNLIAKSTLPTLMVDISDNDIPKAVNKIAEWLEKTGGLYMQTI